MAAGAVCLTRRGTDIGLKKELRARLKTGTLCFKGLRLVSSQSVRFHLENTVNASGNGSLSGSSVSVQWDNYTRAKTLVPSVDTCYLFDPNRILRIQNFGKKLLDSPGPRNYSLVFIRVYSGNGGGYQEPLYKSKTAYYEILGVSAKATQAQIKTAYYKQSFAYHPDRNSGSEEATLRFSEINEAYTVLGNKALRKKYDRGLLSSADLTASARPSSKDAPSASATPRQTHPRRSVMDQEESSRVFDFDNFFKVHYGGQLQREKDIRVRKVEMLKKKETSKVHRLDEMVGFGVGLLMLMAVGIVLSLKR